MSSNSPAPKLPIWVFIAMDFLLVAIGIFVALHSHYPLSETAILAIVGCFIVGAIVGLVPAIVHYERQKNEMLDDRQRALEALARTVTSSAEQISIAAGGLHEIADVAQKNLRHAEQLPHKLQEKIAEFQAQLANANETEKEELEKELEELRSSESERLQATSDKIAKTTTEFAKLEAATQQHLAAATDALSKLNFGTAGAIGKAQAAAEQAMGQARQEAARIVADAATAAVKSIEAAQSAASAEIAAQFETGLERLKEATRQLEAAADKASTPPAPAIGYTVNPPPPAAEPEPPATVAVPEPVAAAPADTASPTHEPPATPPKRPRKPRREEPAPTHAASTEPEATPSVAETEAPAPAPVDAAPTSEPAEPPVFEAAPVPPAEAAPVPPAEPTPVPAETIAEVAPVAPETAEPFPAAESQPAPETVEPTKPKKRAAKKVDDDQPGLGLDIDLPKTEGDGDGAPAMVERVLTSDGATRLLVTAYIGIGNRLFIRGTGPGLSWEKGVPLQFVSIGKWRWETSEASGPVEIKLLKNDEQECAALGTLTIDPGHQHEVTASFN